jgi:hypothetical protein
VRTLDCPESPAWFRMIQMTNSIPSSSGRAAQVPQIASGYNPTSARDVQRGFPASRPVPQIAIVDGLLPVTFVRKYNQFFISEKFLDM